MFIRLTGQVKYCKRLYFNNIQLKFHDKVKRMSNYVDTYLNGQWRSEGNWRPGAKLNFAPPPPPLKKILKNDIEMYIVFN